VAIRQQMNTLNMNFLFIWIRFNSITDNGI
jgi:hypothetical protein